MQWGWQPMNCSTALTLMSGSRTSYWLNFKWTTTGTATTLPMSGIPSLYLTDWHSSPVLSPFKISNFNKIYCYPNFFLESRMSECNTTFGLTATNTPTSVSIYNSTVVYITPTSINSSSSTVAHTIIIIMFKNKYKQQTSVAKQNVHTSLNSGRFNCYMSI